METTSPRYRTLATLTAAAMLMASVGCQVDVGGQTLPSGYYLQDDIQYYAPGTEFKLSREAAAIEAAAAENLAPAPPPQP
ncbi:MAG: hypothetical protein WDZ59_05920 [Pirellulales bacterium]